MHSFVSFYDFSIFAQQPVQIDFFSLCRIFGCGGRVLHKVPLLSDSKQLKFVLGGEAPRAPFLFAFPSFSQSNFRRTTQAMKKSAVFAAFAIKGSFGIDPPNPPRSKVQGPPRIQRVSEGQIPDFDAPRKSGGDTHTRPLPILPVDLKDTQQQRKSRYDGN